MENKLEFSLLFHGALLKLCVLRACVCVCERERESTIPCPENVRALP